MITEKHIETFVAQAHRVGELGLTICSSGNLSWRIGDKALISGTGSWVPSLREKQVSVCDVATGEVLNGVKPSMESVFHLGVMRERPDVGVVLHFQSPYATQVACSEVRPKSYNVTAEVPLHVGRVIPEIPFYRPGSPELAEAVVNALRDRNSALMLKHGQGHVLRDGLPYLRPRRHAPGRPHRRGSRCIRAALFEVERGLLCENLSHNGNVQCPLQFAQRFQCQIFLSFQKSGNILR